MFNVNPFRAAAVWQTRIKKRKKKTSIDTLGKTGGLSEREAVKRLSQLTMHDSDYLEMFVCVF